jgi:DNA-binding XRE family transcriptional regulator
MNKNSTNHRMTITKAAEIIGVVPRTIVRWENAGNIKKAKRKNGVRIILCILCEICPPFTSIISREEGFLWLEDPVYL